VPFAELDGYRITVAQVDQVPLEDWLNVTLNKLPDFIQTPGIRISAIVEASAKASLEARARPGHPPVATAHPSTVTGRLRHAYGGRDQASLLWRSSAPGQAMEARGQHVDPRLCA
jgi:hypothetical protein